LILAVNGKIPRLNFEFFWKMRHGFFNFGESVIFSLARKAAAHTAAHEHESTLGKRCPNFGRDQKQITVTAVSGVLRS